MKYLQILLISILFVFCSAYNRDGHRRMRPTMRFSRRPTESSRATWRQTTIANRFFAHRLYNNIARHRPHGNIVISPFVVSTGLSMTLLGAKGETERELMNALDYSNIGLKKNGEVYTKDDVPRFYQMIINSMKNSSKIGGYMFTIASRLFAEQTQTFSEDFVEDTEEYFGARLEKLDFVHNAEDARTHINDWVNNKTHNTIPEAVPSGYITSNTLLTLVSTAYFKGEWKNKFDPDKTSFGPFTRRNGDLITAQYMNGDFRLKYKYSLKAQSHIVILPYKSAAPGASGYSVSMELYLPFKSTDLRRLEQLGEDHFHRVLKSMPYHKVQLKLPKFRIEDQVDLPEILSRLNVETLFSPAADLSGMNGERNLFLGTAIHKTFMEVNEEGTTAGASVALGSSRSANQFIKLNFDRTFRLIIREKSTNTILFMGRIDQPMTS